MSELKHLKESLKGLNLLYIENTPEFRTKVSKELDGLFEMIYVAKSKEDGLIQFKKHRSKIVIIDEEQVSFNWMEIAEHIKSVRPETKIIILSKHDGEKYLYDAIDIGVTKFLRKPLESKAFVEAIEIAVAKIKQEDDAKLFHTCLHGIYNFQKSMVVMLERTKPLLANERFLDFFDIESVDEFTKEHQDLGSLFLTHEGFLSNSEEMNWLDEISANEEKLYHVNINNTKGEARHFLFKYHSDRKRPTYALLAFDDVTDLNLAELFEAEKEHENKKINTEKSLFNLLELIHKNKITVHLYNYYKGLTIINDATVEEIKDGAVVLKTDYLQQKAIKHEGKTLISSEVLPTTISCDTIVRNSFENQSVKVKNVHFSRTSAATRKTIRLLPDEKHSVSLFVDNRSKYKGYMTIEDISLDSVKLKFSVPPTELKIDEKVVIDMVLSSDHRPFIVNTTARVLKKMNMSVIFSLGLDMYKKNNLLKYITARQLEIIKEFKVLDK